MSDSTSFAGAASLHDPPRGATAAGSRALCVDLDGTLVKSDTLIDALLLMVRTHPSELWRLPGWALAGKAIFKQEVTSRVQLDVAHLPYNHALLTFLEKERGEGRRIFLATGADRALADRISAYLGIFDGVLASDGHTNLTGHNKLAAFEQSFGAAGFDYIGNAEVDLPLLLASGSPMVANPDGALRRAIRAGRFTPQTQFVEQGNPVRTLRRAVRAHQWFKNVLIFVPLLLAHRLQLDTFFFAFLAFVSFSLCASATYIVNDLLDIDADRRHPRKRYRPFAAAELQGKTGVLLSAALLLASFGLAFALPPGFRLFLLLYLGVTLSYSLYFKRIVLVDVVILSGLYTLRLLAGASASAIEISPWLAAFSIFLFLSLAIAKRFAELQNLRAAGHTPTNGRGYLLSDFEQMRAFGTASAYASVVVFSLYISERDVTYLYAHPQRMWLITPLMILWISRVWLLASRGELDEDPVIFALSDRMSLLLGFFTICVVLLATV